MLLGEMLNNTDGVGRGYSHATQALYNVAPPAAPPVPGKPVDPDDGTGYLIGTRIYANGIFNGGELYYLLPAPLGHYLPGAFKCETVMCNIVRPL